MPANIRNASLLSFALAACTQAEQDPQQHIQHQPVTIAQAVCPAPDLLEHAVCVCEDLSQVGELYIKEGPAGIGSVGVNGRTRLVATAEAVGDWLAWGGFEATGTSIGQNLITPKDVEITGEATIGGDAVIGGDLLATGSFGVLGSLKLGGSEDIVGESSIASRAPFEALPAQPPCGCDPATFFDPRIAVAAAKQAMNGDTSFDEVGSVDLHLATGSYYATAAQLVGDGLFTIEGNVTIFVEGNLSSVGSAHWNVLPGATLDLFVSGDVESVGDLTAGNESSARDFRLYVGGQAASVGSTTFFGSIYAPNADVSYVGDARIVGSIFAKSLEGTGVLTVEYGDPLTPPSSCSQPPGDDDQDDDGSSDPVLL